MPSVPPLRFCFESFELDEATRELWRDGRPIGLQPRTLDLLAYLIRHRDHAVSKEQLLSSVWSGVVVNGEAVSRAVHLARKALGDDGRGQLFIRTVQRHGFRFVARVREAFPSSSLVRPAAAATSGTGGVDFVGRESIFTQLDRVLGEAAAGRGRLVLLRGEAGSGKTQTCARFAARARERGARAFMGRAPREDEGAPPYWPWVQILGSLVEEDAPVLSTRPADAACHLAQLVPTLRLHLPDLPPAPRLPPKRSRFRLFDSAIAFLRSAAREAPLVLVIDDLHCADSASLLLLAFLARELEDLRALVIGTYREEEVQAGSHLAECLADLCREAAVERMQLDGLSPDEVALLVERMSGRQVSGELCSALHRKTAGNPFFTAELVHFLESSGQLDRAGATAVSRLRLPRTVSAVVGRRIARLKPGTRRILQVAAVVGTRFDVRVLRSAFPGVSAESLEEAVEQGVLLEQPDEVGVFQFRHELVRDTIDQSLAAATRTRLHRRVAEALEALRGAGEEVPSATLAHHSFEAVGGGGDAHKALSYAIQAGQDAVAGTAYGSAAHHYDRALRVLDLLRDASEHQRCELLIELGHTQLWAGDLGGSRQTLERAAALAKRIGASRLLARAALAIERDRLDQPFDALQVRLLREALACLPPEGEALRARLLAQLAIALYWSEQTERSGRLSARAVALARRAGDSEALGWALSARYLALLRPGLERRRHALTRAMQHAARETRSSDLALITAGVAYGEALERGDPRRAREAVAAVRDRVGVAALPQALLLPPALAASQALLEGNLERAELLGREVLTLGERLGDPLGRMIFVAQLGALRYQQERLAELEGAIREVLLRETDLLTALAILALAQCQSGREVLARDTFERALANELRGLRRDANWSITVAALAEVAARLRDRRRAALLYDLLLPHANRNVVVMLGIALCGPISRYLGLLAGTLGRADEAVGRLGQGARAMRHLGARAWLARIHAEYALALLRRGRSEDRRAAARALASARRASQRLGLAGPCATHHELEQSLRASGMDVS